MKTTIILSFLILSINLAQAQPLTEKYLKKIPDLPKDSCNISKEAADHFQQKVLALIDEIKNEIDKLKEAEKNQGTENEEVAKEHAMQQMSQQYGLSQEQMKQMRSGKMSAADKQALANQVLQQQTNMSIDEVQNLSKMSDAGRKAYANAIGTEMMAVQASNQEEQTSNNSSANMYQLIQNQQTVMSRINATSQNIGKAYNDIESDPELQKMFEDIKTWQNKRMAMAGVDYGQGPQMDSLSVLIKTTQIKICDKYTPQYHSALGNHYSKMKALLPDQQKLMEITANINKIQTGTEIPAANQELGELESIHGYLNKLANAYQYKLYYPEEDAH